MSILDVTGTVCRKEAQSLNIELLSKNISLCTCIERKSLHSLTLQCILAVFAKRMFNQELWQ